MDVFYRILPPVHQHGHLLLVPSYHVLPKILSIILGTGAGYAVF